jgi:PAS domain S-box-containing protein
MSILKRIAKRESLGKSRTGEAKTSRRGPGVKTILIGTLLGLTLVQVLFTADTISARRDDLSSAHVVIERVGLARALLDAVQAVAQERGHTNTFLRSPVLPRDMLPDLRAQSDDRMAKVLAASPTPRRGASLRILWSDVLAYRNTVDAALAAGDLSRQRDIANAWMPLANAMIEALDQALRDAWFLDEEVSREGRNLWILVTFAARLRVAAGQDAATVVGDLIDGVRPTPRDRERAARDLGAIGEIWRDLRRAATPFPPAAEGIARIDKLYWEIFLPIRDRALAARSEAAIAVSLNRFLETIAPALAAVSQVGHAAGDMLLDHARAEVSQAREALAVECALLTLYLALSAGAISLLHFRLSRPLSAMAETLARAQEAAAEGAPAGPRAQPRDEVARLSAAIDDYLGTLEALKASETRFRLAAKAAQDGIWDWDLRTGRIWFSPRWKEQLGYADEEFENSLEAWKRAMLPADWDRALIQIEAYNAGTTDAFDMVQRFRHRDGHTVHIHSRAIHERDGRGAVARMVGAHTDITAQVEHAAEMTAAREKAEEANRAKSTFLAIISHELRTPLTGILGMADMLLASNPGDRRAHWLTVLRNSGLTLLRLVNDILDYSKIEAGRMTLEILNHDPLAVAREVAESLRAQAQAKGLDITFHGEAVGMRASDPMRLRQILLNLLGNALKFTDQGRVSLRVAPVGAPHPTTGVRSVLFEVWDTGIGLTEEQLSRLFAPFTQADESIARRHGGTGLGLVISQRLCAALGGHITCHSVPGEGSRFHFTLPLPPASDDYPSLEAGPVQDLPVLGGQPPLSLLVAEDNETNRLLLREVLTGQGHAVTLAADGDDAVKAFEAAPPDAIIMDMQMPGMDGVAATRHIRARERQENRPHTPVLCLTANVNAADGLGEDAALFDAFLTKPIDWTLLAATLAAVTTTPLGRGRQDRSPRAPDSQRRSTPSQEPPRPGEWRNAAVFDKSWINALPGDLAKARVETILRSLETRLRPPLERLRAAGEDGDAEAVARLGHSLRGLASQFGLRRVAILADLVEEAAKTGRLDHLPALLPPLEEETAAALAAIAEQTTTDIVP